MKANHRTFAEVRDMARQFGWPGAMPVPEACRLVHVLEKASSSALRRLVRGRVGLAWCLARRILKSRCGQAKRSQHANRA
jgi:hypothetical protein